MKSVEIEVFEKLFKGPEQEPFDAESFWDAKAADFSTAQQKERMGFSGLVAESLLQKGLLRGNVLDIGGGTGRYALAFAPHVKSLTLSDISPQMLFFARKNLENAGFKNIEYTQLDWKNVDIEALGLTKKYDLTFAAMTAASRSNEGLKKMASASRGCCCIAQSIQAEDNVYLRLKEALHIPPAQNIYGDRDSLQAYFNLLWMQGYNPEIVYLSQEKQSFASREDIVERYGGFFADIAANQGTSLNEVVFSAFAEDTVHCTDRETLALLVWKV